MGWWAWMLLAGLLAVHGVPSSAARATAPLLAGADPRPALHACLERRRAAPSDKGSGRSAPALSVLCPELRPLLLTRPWSAVLPQRLPAGEEAERAALSELRALLDADLGPAPPGSGPRLAAREPILHGLDVPQHRHWGARLLARLQRLRDRQDAPPQADLARSWPARLGLTPLSGEGLLRLTLAALAAGVLLCGWQLVLLRAAGGRARGAGQPLSAARAESRQPAPVPPLEEAPRVLLEQVMGELSARGQLAGAGGLTVRELLTRVRTLDPEDRERLAALARAAEAVRYAPALPPAPMLHAALAGGRTLLATLLSAPGA